MAGQVDEKADDEADARHAAAILATLRLLNFNLPAPRGRAAVNRGGGGAGWLRA